MLRGSQSISDLTSHLPDKYKQQSASRPDSAMSDYHTHVTNRSCKYYHIYFKNQPIVIRYLLRLEFQITHFILKCTMQHRIMMKNKTLMRYSVIPILNRPPGIYYTQLTPIISYSFLYLLDAEVSSRPSSTEPHSMDNNSSLRRACSLSDLNRPAVTKRLLPAPPGEQFSIPLLLFFLSSLFCFKKFYFLTFPVGF